MSNSKPTWHGGFPWGRIRQWYRFLRRLFFSAPEPTNRPSIVVDVSLEELQAVLGQRSFAPNWETSYYKRGEDLNLARVELDLNQDHVDDNGEPILWWQTHVRGWEREGGYTELRAHWEPEPTEHPQPHLDGVGHDTQRAIDTIQGVLDDAKISFEE